MNGVLVIDKPQGPTSFDVVRRVAASLEAEEGGPHRHAGSDGHRRAARSAWARPPRSPGFITEGDKAYDAVVRLGAETDTQDAEGKVLATRPGARRCPPSCSRRRWSASAGTFAQMPPMYSAVKVRREAALRAARAPARRSSATPRQVTVHALVLRDFSATELHAARSAARRASSCARWPTTSVGRWAAAAP